MKSKIKGGRCAALHLQAAARSAPMDIAVLFVKSMVKPPYLLMALFSLLGKFNDKINIELTFAIQKAKKS